MHRDRAQDLAPCNALVQQTLTQPTYVIQLYSTNFMLQWKDFSLFPVESGIQKGEDVPEGH